MTEVNLICCTFYNIFHVKKAMRLNLVWSVESCPYTGKFLIKKAFINTADGTLLQEDDLKPKSIFFYVDLKRH